MFLKSQKNDIHKAIQDNGLNWRDFHLEEKTELRIIHIATGYYYRIYTSNVIEAAGGAKGQRLESLFSPNFQAPIVTAGEGRLPAAKNWSDLMGFVNLWLAWLKAEVEQPDLWAEMEYADKLFDDAEVVTDEQFTQAEIKLLEARVPDIEQQIIDLDLPPDAQAAITAIVRKVPDKATRFTKKELSDSLVGSFIKVGFKWQLTTADIGDVWLVSQQFFTLALP